MEGLRKCSPIILYRFYKNKDIAIIKSETICKIKYDNKSIILF